MFGAALPAMLGIGAAVDIGSRIAGAAGGGRQSTVDVDPFAREGLRLGVEGAEAGLEATPAVGSESVLEGYRASAQRLAELGLPEPTITDPFALAERIVESARDVAAPEIAAGRRRVEEAAGSLGPSTATAQAFAGQEAQTENYMAQIMAQLAPELLQQQYGQDVEQLRSALGLEQARQRVELDPYQVINTIRQGYTGQLLGAGRPSSVTPTEYGVPGFAAVGQGAGQTISQIPQAAELVKYLRSGQQTGVGTPNAAPGTVG